MGEAPAPIVGWNGGSEDTTTMLSTKYGHIQTATNFCWNLPVTMANSENRSIRKVRQIDPAGIDWNDQRSRIAFITTDGDNVQWYMGSFFYDDYHSWWSSRDRGSIPLGWSNCFTELREGLPCGAGLCR